MLSHSGWLEHNLICESNSQREKNRSKQSVGNQAQHAFCLPCHVLGPGSEAAFSTHSQVLSLETAGCYCSERKEESWWRNGSVQKTPLCQSLIQTGSEPYQMTCPLTRKHNFRLSYGSRSTKRRGVYGSHYVLASTARA